MQKKSKRSTAQHRAAHHSIAQRSSHETPTHMSWTEGLPVSREHGEAIELGGTQHVHHGVYSFHSFESNHWTRHDLQAMHARSA